mmetsp:Transcript_7196/g.23799  ORF Transcript_7196/g.23799 Transcript_7196/m.23799 type:complete len:217 (+) Transcript_7196:116-766(+)
MASPSARTRFDSRQSTYEWTISSPAATSRKATMRAVAGAFGAPPKATDAFGAHEWFIMQTSQERPVASSEGAPPAGLGTTTATWFRNARPTRLPNELRPAMRAKRRTSLAGTAARSHERSIAPRSSRQAVWTWRSVAAAASGPAASRRSTTPTGSCTKPSATATAAASAPPPPSASAPSAPRRALISTRRAIHVLSSAADPKTRTSVRVIVASSSE